MSTAEAPYHHGDLRSALVKQAMTALEAGEPYSLRAVARGVGVSATAPYRHFADRTALDSAVAVEGFRALGTVLTETLAAQPEDAEPAEVLAELAVTYVDFALARPALFRLMFGNECDPSDSERVRASQELHTMLDAVLAQRFPEQASEDFGTAAWGLAHGLAALHLDGKYRPESPDEVAARVRGAVMAMLGR